MRYYIIIVAWLLLIIPSTAFLPPQCRADTDAEIQHLKDFIENSECIFIRNNVEYDSAEALKHIMRIYDATQPILKWDKNDTWRLIAMAIIS